VTEKVLDNEDDNNSGNKDVSENDESGPVSVGEETEEKSTESLENPVEEEAPTTPEAEKDVTENGNANESNTASSSMTTSVSSSDSIDEADATDENDCADDSSTIQTLVFSPSWSESLKSPKDIEGFSPSESGSGHGMGLQLGVERSVATAIFLGNVSVFFTNTAALYEQLGMNLVKMAQYINPEQMPRGIPMNDDFQALYDDLLLLGRGFRSLGKFYRSSIIAPLKKILSRNGGQRDAAVKQYKDRKLASISARKLALVNLSKLTNATQSAEDEIRSWYSLVQGKASETEEESKETEGAAADVDKDFPWVKALKLIGKTKKEEDATIRLIMKLKLVETCRTQYSENIQEENNCVLLSQESESLALSTAQKAEEDQLNFLVKDIFSQVFPQDKNGENVPLSRNSMTMNDSDRTNQEGLEKKGIELLSTLKLFKQPSLSYEEGMGVMDAETLGLPESLGMQRDKIRSSFSARENRIEVTEIILKLFEEISTVTSKSSLRMLSLISNQRRKETSEGPISDSSYNSNFGSVWRETLNVFEEEAKLISGMAFRITKLEKWLTVSKRILENEKDLDDASWKRVCDAARAEMRLESRYKQTKQSVQKSRQRTSSKELVSSLRILGAESPQASPRPQRSRVNSAGSGSASSMGFPTMSLPGLQATPNKFGRAFLKGGEKFKSFTENAMTQIAQIGIEGDQKEAKDQQAFEQASSEKKSAVLAYESWTKERIEKIESEDESGWTEMKEIVSKLSGSITELTSARPSAFQKQISQELESSLQPFIASMEEWPEKGRKKIQESEQTLSSTTSPEFALSAQSTESEIIDPLLGMTEKDLTIPDLNLPIETTDEKVTDEPPDTAETASSSGSDVVGDEDSEGSEKEVSKATNSVTTEPEPEKKIEVSKATIEKESTVDKKGGSEEDNGGEKEKKESTNMKAFIKQFWSKMPKDENVPTILDVVQCAYRPKERGSFLLSNLYGKLYTTKDAIYFLAANKNFTLKWDVITSVEKEKGLFGAVNDTDIVVSYRSGDEIAAFLLCRVKDRDDVVAKLQALKAESEDSELSQAGDSDDNDGPQLPPVPPDNVLKKMEVVVSKTIKNTSIKSVFENVWADRIEGESFYKSWLEEEECFDISMNDWEIAENGKKFKNEWCNEEYDQKRQVDFKFNRTTHLYIGPPVAIVKQRHFIRVEDNDRCVLAISAEFEGIPYADTFAVEMRWIATRTGRKDVMVKLGLFVNFKKSTMMKSQIKSGTITETKSVQMRLFDAVKKACATPGDGEADDGKEEEEEGENETDTTEQGLLSKLGQFSDYLDLGKLSGYLGGSKIVPFVGAAALFFVGRFLTSALFGSSSPSEIQRLEATILELRSEVRALHDSIDSITLLLKDVQRDIQHNRGE